MCIFSSEFVVRKSSTASSFHICSNYVTVKMLCLFVEFDNKSFPPPASTMVHGLLVLVLAQFMDNSDGPYGHTYLSMRQFV